MVISRWTVATTGDWDAAAHWNTGAVPNDPTAQAVVTVPGTYAVAILPTDDITVGNLKIGVGATVLDEGILNAGTIDLTHGRFIAGTGTIDPAGNVGPIGGIQLKMIAARKAGATVFLAPAGNCSDVKGDTPSGLDVIKVQTLHGAVEDLQALNAGKPTPEC